MVEKLIDIVEEDNLFTFGPEGLYSVPEIGLGSFPVPYHELVDRCKTALAERDPREVFLWMPNLIRAITDFSIDRKVTPARNFDSKVSVSNANYLAFKGDFDRAYDILNVFAWPDELLERDVYDTTDEVTWACTNPRYVRRLAKKMEAEDYTPSRILLGGHGSYRPGLMLASILQIGFPFVVRCSMDKNQDDGPNLAVYEEEKLGRVFEQEELLIFEEDTHEGDSMHNLVSLAHYLNPSGIKTAASVALRAGLERGYRPDFVAHEGTVDRV